HERMYEADNRKAWPCCGIANWCATTIGVPAQDLAGEPDATHRTCASAKLHATRWHLEDVCSACRVEHVRPFEEARERLAICAIANKAEASGRRNLARDTVPPCDACGRGSSPSPNLGASAINLSIGGCPLLAQSGHP